MDELLQVLQRWDRRQRSAQSLVWTGRGLAAGLVAALLLALAARIWPLLPVEWLLALTGIWAALGLLAAFLLVWLWPRTPIDQARAFDRRLGLAERVSTALEIRARSLKTTDDLAREQLDDAVHAVRKVDVRAAIPLRWNWRDWAPALFALALVAGAIWLPNPMQAELAERAAVRQALRDEVESLEALREEIAADEQLSEADREALLEALDDSIEELRSGDLSREEALAELNAASERLRSLEDPGAESRSQALAQAGAGMQNSAVTNALGQALNSGDLAAAAELLQDMADEIGETLTREEELELAEQLAEAAAGLASTDPALAGQLAAAAGALEAGDAAAAREALGQASQSTAQAGQQIAGDRAARRAAAQAGSSGQQVAQAGQSASGQGSQSGSGQQGGQSGSQSGSGQNGSGQGQQPGQGAGGGAGRGESAGIDGAGNLAGPMDSENGAADGGLRDFESVYAPQRLGGEGGPEMELSTEGDPGELVRELTSNPELGRSSVPYNQVYANYVDAAGQVLDDQNIPLGLRDYVRDYFSSLEP